MLPQTLFTTDSSVLIVETNDSTSFSQIIPHLLYLYHTPPPMVLARDLLSYCTTSFIWPDSVE